MDISKSCFVIVVVVVVVALFLSFFAEYLMHACFFSDTNASTLISYFRYLSSCTAFPVYFPIDLSHSNQELLF